MNCEESGNLKRKFDYEEKHYFISCAKKVKSQSTKSKYDCSTQEQAPSRMANMYIERIRRTGDIEVERAASDARLKQIENELHNYFQEFKKY